MFTGKHLGWSLFFNKVTGPQACHFIEKSLQHGFFPVNNGKFLKTPVLKNVCERLLPFMALNTVNSKK